jgi:membrane-bound lytic murein transglycosylase B
MGANKGTKHHNSKLTPAKVRAARKTYATGKTTFRKLADKYSVSEQTIWSAITGRTWKDVA